MIGNRMSKSEDSPASGYDWVFLGAIFLVGATGMLTEILRLMDNAALAYPMYFVHLVFVFYVIAFLPYSKLAHLLYRPLAIIHAKNVGRTRRLPPRRPPRNATTDKGEEGR
jgi:quinone-modifying oxidoreductase subunit QmoC